jgi:glycosyltransferase involved in cell wall biosynthesis
MVNMNSILLTNSPIGYNVLWKKEDTVKDAQIRTLSGGSVVSLNLLEVLREVSDVKMILGGQHFTDAKYEGIPAHCIKPEQFRYDCLFFSDYFAKALVQANVAPSTSVDLVLSYAGPWSDTFEYLKREHKSKIIADFAPHRVDLSMEEHLKFHNEYPYSHYQKGFLFDMLMKFCKVNDALVVHSKSSAEYLKSIIDLKREPFVIPHGTYIPSSIPPYPTEFTPGYMGSMGADKGINYLVCAIASTTPAMKLVIGGKESSNFGISDPRFKDRFQVLGAIGELCDFYEKVSVFVGPSITEGFGICGLEAMAHGRPIITTNGTGLVDLIQDGKEGFTVPIRDPLAIKEKLEWFRDNPSEVVRMGREARNTAERYSWKIVKSMYVKLIKEVME